MDALHRLRRLSERREAAVFGGHEMWIASAEDIASLKAFSDRPRDLEDLIALLRVSSLDVDPRPGLSGRVRTPQPA